ncbi:DNA repair protein [Malassezia pachydermatis]
MRVRGAENPLLAEQAKALDGRVGTKRRRTEENNESSSRKAISSATAYILRSTLPSNVIQALTMSSSTASSMVDWRQTEDETGSMGLLFVILSLILLSGRQVGEGKLRAYLAQLSLFIDRPLPTAIQTHGARTVDDLADARRGHNEQSNLESFLQQMQRYGYLEKVRVAASAETPSAPSFEWRWGARAELEIGEAGVAAFVTDLYQNGAKSENENVASELRRRIERAAGTPLVG